MGFPIPLVMVASCSLDLTYPHRHVTYFQFRFFMENPLSRLVPWLGERWTWGGMVSNASETEDPCLSGKSSVHPP